MGTRFNALYQGTPTEVGLIIDENTLNESELRAALCNAFRRIDTLQMEVEKLKRANNQSCNGGK